MPALHEKVPRYPVLSRHCRLHISRFLEYYHHRNQTMSSQGRSNDMVKHGKSNSVLNRPELCHARPQEFQTVTPSSVNRLDGCPDLRNLGRVAFVPQVTLDYNRVLETGYENSLY